MINPDTDPEIMTGPSGPTASAPGAAPAAVIGDAFAARPGGLAGGLVRTARPKQWIKNVLVLAAPGAAGSLTHVHPLLLALGAMGVFCVVASGTYFVNDALDVSADRLHPVKRHRPIAAGVVPVPLAWGTGLALLGGGVAAGGLLAGSRLALVVGAYAAITLAYSTRLKHEPILDLAAVASGFVLRAIAGGVASGVPLSDWFLIVASFGSLFMVAGKRYAEHKELGEARAGHRATLGAYSLSFLGYVRSVSSAVAIAAYCLWAFEKAAHTHHGALWFELSIVPFVIGLLRYALLLDAGQGGAPEEVVLGDRQLQVVGLAWALIFALGVYGLG